MQIITTLIGIVVLTTLFVAVPFWRDHFAERDAAAIPAGRTDATSTTRSVTEPRPRTDAHQAPMSQPSASEPAVSADQLAVLAAQIDGLTARIDALSATNQRTQSPNPAAIAEAAAASAAALDAEVERVVAGLAREPGDSQTLARFENLRHAAPEDAFGSAHLVDSYCSTHYCRIEYRHDDLVDREMLVDNLPLFLPHGARAHWKPSEDGQSTVAYVTLHEQ